MKRQQKKAFTLVELLVVIAILAILASVAVVGYTSFMKNAAVSNDQNLAEQMNRYMEALRADSSKLEFYNKEFKEDAEILALIAEICDKGGLEHIEASAAKYGYHFYFSIADQKFMALDENEAIEMGDGASSVTPTRHFLSMMVMPIGAANGTYQHKSPFRSFTKTVTDKSGNEVKGNYFFADTVGDWAEMFRKYYDKDYAITDDMDTLYENAQKMNVGGTIIPGFADLMRQTGFFINGGEPYRVDQTITPSIIVSCPNTLQEENDTEKGNAIFPGTVTSKDGSTELSAENPLVAPKEGEELEIDLSGFNIDFLSPEFLDNLIPEDSTATITITTNLEGLDECEAVFPKGANTIPDNIIILNKDGERIKITTEVTTDPETNVETISTTIDVGGVSKEVTAKNKVKDFTVAFSGESGKVNTTDGYIAIDGGTFTLSADEFEGTKTDDVFSKKVKWEISSVYYYKTVDEDGETVEVEIPYETYSSYISTPEMGQNSSFKITLKDNELHPIIDGIRIKATPEFGVEGLEKTIDLKVVRIDNFNVSVVDDNSNKVDGSFVAWDGKNFSLTANTFTPNHVVDGITLNTPTVTYKLHSVEGDVSDFDYSDYVTVSSDGALTLSDDNGVAPAINTVTVRATSNTNCYKDYKINVVRITGITGVTLGGKALNLDGNDAHYFMNTNTDGVNSSFALSYSADNIVDNMSGEGKSKVTLDVELSLSGNTETFSFGNGNSVALVGTLKDLPNAQSINVTIKNLKTVGVSLKMYNTDELNFQTIKTNGALRLVGDDNAITLGELFTLNNNMSVPANAQVWFTTGYNGTDTAPGVIDTEADGFGWSRYGTTTKINATDWAATEIQFKNGATNSAEAQEVYISIVIPTDEGYRRISDTRVLSVVDGFNVKSWADMVAHAGNSVVVFTTSKIDITAGTTDTYTIPANKTFYGNGVTLDLSGAGATFSTGGIITLAGKIQDTKLIGPVYSEFGLQRNQENGAAVITSSGTACEIENCYIAHARSPLVLYENSVITVKDSIFYGGTGANIILYANSTLKIDGKVATIQTGENGIIGGGIVGWIDDGYKHIEVLKDADLRQYNFVNSALAEKFPTILMVMPLSDPFNDLIKKEEYSGYWFGSNLDKAENRYVNSAIMTVDKYYGLTYSISDTYTTSETKVSTGYYTYCYACGENHPTGFALTDDCCSSSRHGGNFHFIHEDPTEELTNQLVSTVTLTLTRYVAADMDYTISYDATKFSHSDGVNGKLNATWTGTELTKDVTFNAIANIAWQDSSGWLSSDPSYWLGFSVAQETPVMGITSTVAGNDGDTTISGVPGYTSTEYTWTVSEIIWKTAETFAEKLGASVHSFGLHSSTAVFDCHSTQNSNENAQAWFAEWQDMVAEGSAHEYHPNYTNTFGTTGKLFP